MTVTDVRIRNWRLSEAIFGKGNARQTIVIDTDDPEQTWSTVKSQAENFSPPGGLQPGQTTLPPLYSSWNFRESIPRLYCERTRWQQLTSEAGDSLRTRYLVVCEFVTPGFSSRPTAAGLPSTDGDMVLDPLARPAKYWMEYERQNELVTVARNKADLGAPPWRPAGTLGPVETTAGEQLQDVLHEPATQYTLVIQKNYATWREAYRLNEKFDRSRNDGQITIDGQAIPQYKAAWAGATSGQPLTEQSTNYFSIEIRLLIGRLEWEKQVPNVGFWHLESASDDLAIRATDKKGDPTVAPVKIAADGTRLNDRAQGINLTWLSLDDLDYSELEGIT